MNKDSKMTIEDLAVLMEKRFAQQDKKFDAKFETFLTIMDRRFIEQEKRFDAKLDAKLDERFDTFAGMILRSFEAQSLQIQAVLNELQDFKTEANIKFVTHREFDQFKLRLKS